MQDLTDSRVTQVPSHKTNPVRLMTKVNDYVGDKYWATVIAKRIEEYWKRRGFPHVKAWVEQENREGNPIWNVRSNLKFTVPT